MISAHANNEDSQESASITPGGTHAVQENFCSSVHTGLHCENFSADCLCWPGRKIYIHRPEIPSIPDKPVNSYASSSVQHSNSQSGVIEEEEDAGFEWPPGKAPHPQPLLKQPVTSNVAAAASPTFASIPSELDLTDEEEEEEVEEEMVKAIQQLGAEIRDLNASCSRVASALQELILHSQAITHSVDPVPLRRQGYRPAANGGSAGH